MSQATEYVSLATLGSGAAAELFETELQRAVDNMLDPNSSADKARSVTMKVTMKPTKPGMCDVEIEVSSKLAGPGSVATTFFIGKDKGKAVASEYNPQQADLPFNQQPQVDEQTGEVIRMVK